MRLIRESLRCWAVADALLLAMAVNAQTYDMTEYYGDADGKKGEGLKSTMSDIVYSHTERSYANLWTDFYTTDVRDDGKVWDMYSGVTSFVFGDDQAGSYKVEGDVYNREHSFPKSWFDDGTPMYTDLYHLYPTDGYVNSKRSNYCFGEVKTATYSSEESFSLLGTPTDEIVSDGCGETLVFEPNDAYKGDFARTYFYMVTAYEDVLPNWSGCGMINNTKYPAFTTWAKNMLLRWASEDQVSEKETRRIEAVYSIQKNRNPFIDFPGLEMYIWGSWKDSTFSVSNYVNPYTYVAGEDGNDDDEEEESGDVWTADGKYYVKVTSAPSSWSGEYLIVYEDEEGGYAFDGSLSTLDATNNVIEVVIADDQIEATENVQASAFVIEQVSGGYTIKSASGMYIGRTGSSNGMDVSDESEYVNSIALNGENAVVKGTSCTLCFNAASDQMRFRFYKNASQKAISLYRREASTATVMTRSRAERVDEAYYDMMGRRYESKPQMMGVYVHKGKKIIVR